jgi:hypothetical protein
MKNTAQIASGGTIYTQRFMTIGLGIQVILKVLPQFPRLYCWQY